MTCSSRAFFTRLVARFDELNIKYCLLGGADESGDIDFMVDEPHRNSIGLLIKEVARSLGGRLVQAIAHETSACFYVVSIPTAGGIAYVQLDCYADYRRDGRLWLDAARMVARRRPLSDFYAPQVRDEFVYYMIKKILKQQVCESQLRRLRNLYCANPFACDDELRRLWSGDTLNELKGLLLSQDVEGFRAQLPNFRCELLLSRQADSFLGSVSQHIRDLARVIRRIVAPTGFTVAVAGDDLQQRQAFCRALERSLSPVFRKSQIVELTPSSLRTTAPNDGLAKEITLECAHSLSFNAICRLSLIWKLFVAKCRSSLSLVSIRSRSSTRRLPYAAQFDLLLELRLSLTNEIPEDLAQNKLEEGASGHWLILSSVALEQNVLHATNAVLQRLEKRLDERIRGRRPAAWLRKHIQNGAAEQTAGEY